MKNWSIIFLALLGWTQDYYTNMFILNKLFSRLTWVISVTLHAKWKIFDSASWFDYLDIPSIKTKESEKFIRQRNNYKKTIVIKALEKKLHIPFLFFLKYVNPTV